MKVGWRRGGHRTAAEPDTASAMEEHPNQLRWEQIKLLQFRIVSSEMVKTMLKP